MPPRFYAPALLADPGPVRLPDEEGAHLTRVMRLGPGDEIRVFDGRGLERMGRIRSVGRDGVIVDPTDRVDAAVEPRVAITLAQAVLKADKLDQVVRDAVMMGVGVIQPLLTARTDVPARAFTGANRLQRWQRIAIASTKQCGRAVLAEVRPPCSLDALFAQTRCDLGIMLVEPGGSSPAAGLDQLRQRAAVASVLVVVGPEGGWTSEEVDLAKRHQCLLVTLGRRTLRADAAPLVALAVLQSLWGDL